MESSELSHQHPVSVFRRQYKWMAKDSRVSQGYVIVIYWSETLFLNIWLYNISKVVGAFYLDYSKTMFCVEHLVEC